jgi:hypothetical protein
MTLRDQTLGENEMRVCSWPSLKYLVQIESGKTPTEEI